MKNRRPDVPSTAFERILAPMLRSPLMADARRLAALGGPESFAAVLARLAPGSTAAWKHLIRTVLVALTCTPETGRIAM